MLNNYFEINRTSTEVFELNSKNKRSINMYVTNKYNI